MSTIFISHSNRNQLAAVAMRRWLTEQGHHSLFLDFDPDHGIAAGSHWELTLYHQLRQCQAVVALISPDWLASKWCFAEVVQAREKGKAIFPVKIEPCEPGGLLADLQQLDLTANPDEGYRRLAIGLIEHGLDPTNVFDWDRARPPYPGMMAFMEEDAAVFFGRGEEILQGRESLERLHRLGGEAPRFLLVLGASGSGKSSLVRAGLIPRLKKDPTGWLPLSPFRPREDPLTELALALADAFNRFGRPCSWAEIRAELSRAAGRVPADGQALLDFSRELTIASGRHEATVLLTIDQAEELFGTGTVAQPFLRLLRAALEASHRGFLVLATMRSDYLGNFQTDLALHDPTYSRDLAYETFIVGPMPFQRLSQVIEGPARVAGLRLEEGLTHELIADAGSGDALPLLAFTLRRLYERGCSDGVLEVREYEALGRLEHAVREEAERIVTGLAARDLDALRAAFVPGMVQVSAEGVYARRRAFWDELPEQAKPLLSRFVIARLLVKDVDNRGRETVEVAHEALLRRWPQLIRWLDDDRYKLRLYDGLRRAAREWEDAGRKRQLLVHRRGYLRDTESLVLQPGFTLSKASRELKYLESCIRARRQARIAVYAGIGFLFLALSGFSVWARYQQDVSEQRLALFLKTNSKRLARESEVQADIGRPDRGVLLALAALPDDRGDAQRSFFSEANKVLWAPLDRLLSRTIPPGRRNDADNTSSLTEAAAALWYSLIRQPSLALTLPGTIAALSPDGSRIITAHETTAQIWDASTGKQLFLFQGHIRPIRCIAFSQGGNERIVTGAEDGTARVWDATTGKELFILSGGGKPLDYVAFSPDGKRIGTFSWEDNSTGRIWDATNGREIAAVPEIAGPAALSLDSARVVTADKNGTARVLDAIASKPVTTFLGQRVELPFAAFSPDGSRVITASQSDSVSRVWDVATGREAISLDGEDGTPSFSPDGKRAVTYSQDGGGTGRAHVWDIATGKEGKELFGIPGTTGSVAFSPDSTRMITMHPEGESGYATIRVWDAATGDPISVIRSADTPRSAAFGPNGRRIVVTDAASVRIWDPPLGEPVAFLPKKKELSSELSDIAASADGKRVVIARSGEFGSHFVLHVWDVNAGQELVTLQGSTEGAPSVAISPSGERIAAVGTTRKYLTPSVPGNIGVTEVFPASTAQVWDAATGKELPALQGHGGSIWSMTFDRDDRHILTASADGTARVWDAGAGKELTALRGHGGEVLGAAFAPDGTRVVTASADGTARIWDAGTGKELTALRGHGGEVRRATFAPDGTLVVTASADGTARVWDAGSGKELITFNHGEPLSEATFSSGNRVTTLSEKAASVWDIPTGKEIAHLAVRGISAVGVGPVKLTPSGGRLITGSADGTVQVWDVMANNRLLVIRPGEGYWSAILTGDITHKATRVATGTKGGAPIVYAVDGASVRSVSSNGDGTLTFAGSQRGSVLMWRVPAFAEWMDVLNYAKATTSVELTKDERVQFGTVDISGINPAR